MHEQCQFFVLENPAIYDVQKFYEKLTKSSAEFFFRIEFRPYIFSQHIQEKIP